MANNVTISGRLTRDPDVKYTDSGLAIARFSIAIDRGKDKEGNSKGVDYPNIVVFGKQAENCEKYLGKGQRVLVIGRLQTGSYEKDGTKVYTTDVVANNVEFIDFKDSNATEEPAESPEEKFQALDEAVPF